jgi:hypothetical protein
MTDEPQGFTVKKRGAIGTARADFMCNSATCRTKKGARVYELPAASVKCPVCSKKLTKLMAAPRISRGIAKQTGAMMEREYVRQQRNRDDAKTANRTAPMLGASMKNGLQGAVTEAMARAGMGNIPVPVPVTQAGGAKPTSGITSPHLAGMKAQGAVRVPVDPTTSKRWRPSRDEVAEARRQEET